MAELSRNSTLKRNASAIADVDMGVLFAEGAYKNVYKGVYVNGRGQGQPCVHKVFKSGAVYEASYFATELEIVKKAAELIDSYNLSGLIGKQIYLMQPAIWAFYPGNEFERQKVLVEPFIEKFEKFNSNTGWQKSDQYTPWDHVMQSLSHYSYHITRGQLLLCDLQGGIAEDGGCILTDPVIMSTEKEKYGPSDLGPEGIDSFFANHKCNDLCLPEWIRPANPQQVFAVREGTTMSIGGINTDLRKKRSPFMERVKTVQLKATNSLRRLLNIKKPVIDTEKLRREQGKEDYLGH